MAFIWRHNGTEYASYALAEAAATAGDDITVEIGANGLMLDTAAVDMTKGVNVIALTKGLVIDAGSNGLRFAIPAGETGHIKGLNFNLDVGLSYSGSNVGTMILENVTFMGKYIACTAGTWKCYNCIFISHESSTYVIGCLGCTAEFYHCMVTTVRTDGNPFYITSGTLSVYNCGWDNFNNDGFSITGGTLYQDYNMGLAAGTEGGGGAGANNIQANAVEMGLASTVYCNPWDLRVVLSAENTGTTTANGVDLTAIAELDYDIDGRSRATHGYKIGVSCGMAITESYAGSLTGTVSLPAVADVEEGVLFGASDELTGIFVVPSITRVVDGVTYGASEEFEGIFVVPTEAQVEELVTYGANAEYTGTFEGGGDYPPVTKVIDGTIFGDGELEGIFVVPTEAQVEEYVTYGANEEYTGTLAPGGAAPAKPTISTPVAGDTTLTVTISGTAGLISYIRYRIMGTGTWSDETISFSVEGSGDETITGLTNGLLYEVVAYTKSGTVTSDWTTPVTGKPTASTIVGGVDPDWARWIFASISKHFDDRKGDLEMFIEGQYRDVQPPKDFIELRVDGPYFTEVNKDYYKLYVEVNVLVQSRMDDTNYHRIHTDVGLVANMMTTIQLYKFGTGSSDTGEHFGCLTLLQNTQKRDRIQTNHFGQIDPDVRLMQATVEGHYETELEM